MSEVRKSGDDGVRRRRDKEWRKGKVPLTIVIPAELHFQEKESLDLFRF